MTETPAPGGADVTAPGVTQMPSPAADAVRAGPVTPMSGASEPASPWADALASSPVAQAPGRRRRDRALVAVVALRFVVPLAAVPLIPVLIPEHVVWMLLLRPTKEFQLIGGAQYQLTGAPHPLLLLAAFVPMMVVAVWAYFAVGRMEREALAAGTAPRWLQRALPQRQLAVAQAVLARRGATIAVLGRLGGLPPTVLAAAAGASGISARRYLTADAAGALLSFAVMVRAGMGAGRAWEEGVGWLTAVTAVLFVTVLVLLSRWFRAEARAYDASHPTEAVLDEASHPTEAVLDEASHPTEAVLDEASG